MVYRVRTRFPAYVRGGGFCDLHFAPDGAAGAVEAHAATVAFWDATSVLMSDEIELEVEDEVADLNVVTGELVSLSSQGVVQMSGENTNEPLPPALQMLVRLRTGTVVNGRRLNGRIMVPGCPETGANNGRLTAAYQDQLTGFAETHLIPGGLVVWHRPVQGGGGSAHLVSSATAWSEFAVLRSRRD